MRRRGVIALGVGVTMGLLGVAFLLRPEAREPYRPQFVGAAPPIERHQDPSRYHQPAKYEMYRVDREFDSLVAEADRELKPLGWRRGAKTVLSVNWFRKGPHGEETLQIGDVRAVERRSGKRTSAPRNGRPYALVIVSYPERSLTLWEGVVSQLRGSGGNER